MDRVFRVVAAFFMGALLGIYIVIAFLGAAWIVFFA